MVFSWASQEYLENALSDYQEYLEQKKITAEKKGKKERLAKTGAVIALVIMIAVAYIAFSDSPELNSILSMIQIIIYHHPMPMPRK